MTHVMAQETPYTMARQAFSKRYTENPPANKAIESRAQEALTRRMTQPSEHPDPPVSSTAYSAQKGVSFATPIFKKDTF